MVRLSRLLKRRKKKEARLQAPSQQKKKHKTFENIEHAIVSIDRDPSIQAEEKIEQLLKIFYEYNSCFRSRTLAMLVHRFARHHRGALTPQLTKVLDQVAERAQLSIFDFSAQGLSNLCWAYGRLKHSHQGLLSAISKTIPYRLIEFNSQNIANTAWALARLGVFDEPLLTKLAQAASVRIDEFEAQHLSITPWAFAKLNFLHVELMDTVAQQSTEKVSEFNAQNLSNLAWACAMLSYRDSQLMHALANASLQNLSDFNDQNTANTAFAFAMLQVQRDDLMEAIERIALERSTKMSLSHASSLVWSFTLSRPTAASAMLQTIVASSEEEDIDGRQLLELHHSALALGHTLPETLAERVQNFLDSRATPAAFPAASLQQQVKECLGAMGEQFKAQTIIEGFVLDFLLDQRNPQIVLEVQRPIIFSKRDKSPPTQLGSDQLKRIILQTLGYQFTQIIPEQWSAAIDKQAFLENCLDQSEL